MDFQAKSIDSLKIDRWEVLENFILCTLTIDLEKNTFPYVIEIKDGG
jgi:hypothetical protein